MTGQSSPGAPTVRRLRPDDLGPITEIVRGLPDYFTPDVPAQVERDALAHDGWVLVGGDDRVIGFAVVEPRFGVSAEVLWIAVDNSHRGNGGGTVLLDHVLASVAEAGVQIVEAKTLDRSAAYEPYEATHAFWRKAGFVQVDTINPLPGWQPGNPAAILVAALGPTRTRR